MAKLKSLTFNIQDGEGISTRSNEDELGGTLFLFILRLYYASILTHTVTNMESLDRQKGKQKNQKS